MLKFNIKMPTDPLFCPTLSCGVYDYLFMGMSQPLIGTFTIDLGDHFHNKKSGNQRKIGALAAVQSFEAMRNQAANQPDLLVDETDPRVVKLAPKKDYEMKPLKPAVPQTQGAAGVA